MIRTIDITGRTGRYDVPSFLWTENEGLTLKIVAQEIRRGKFVCTVKHGDSEKTVYLGEEMTVDLTPEWLKAGGTEPLEVLLEFRTLDLARIIIPSGEEKGGYVIEPLTIEHVDDSYTATGWLSKIEAALEEANVRIGAVEARLKAFEDEGVPLVAETVENENEIVDTAEEGENENENQESAN